jgi:hypothetical protein
LNVFRLFDKAPIIDNLKEAESLMPASCHKVLKQALAKGIALDDSTRCTCFMHLNPLAAKKVKCKITEDQQFTLAEEYAQCVGAVSTDVANPGICTTTELQAPFDEMDSACTDLLVDAIENDTPLTQEQRCACYEQVDDSVGLGLACMTMPAKKQTVAQEYQLCMTEAMATTCSETELFGSSVGLAGMTADCKSTFQTAVTKGDEVLETAFGCDCYGKVSASNALNLRCMGTKGSSGTLGVHFLEPFSFICESIFPTFPWPASLPSQAAGQYQLAGLPGPTAWLGQPAAVQEVGQPIERVNGRLAGWPIGSIGRLASQSGGLARRPGGQVSQAVRHGWLGGQMPAIIKFI